MAETQPRSTPSWSDIPLELAGLVFLPAYADRARFAAVCPQWRAAARQLPLPPPLPLLALPDGTFYSLPYSQPFRFPGCGFSGYKSACGSWLVFPRDDGCFLVDPFSGATVTLPALSSVRLRPPHADLKYIPVDKNNMYACHSTWLHIKDAEKLSLSKLMLCSPSLVAAFVGFQNNTQILVCQPGAASWSVRSYDRSKRFHDMAFHKGKLYALADDENLLVVNISQDQSTGDPQVSRIRQVIKGDPWYTVWLPDNTVGKKKLYLVESRGALLMARRKVYCRIVVDEIVAGQSEFEVFEADFEGSRWVNVTTLGDDRVLFLERRCSRAVPVSRMQGDRIFFLDDDEENVIEYFYEEENTSVRVYDMIDHRVSSPLPMISWKRDGMSLATWLLPRD